VSAACDVLLLLVLYVLNKFFCLVQHLFALCSLFFCCSSGTGGCVALPSVAPPRLAGVTLAASLISLLPGPVCGVQLAVSPPQLLVLYCISTGVVGVSEFCCDVLVLPNKHRIASASAGYFLYFPAL